MSKEKHQIKDNLVEKSNEVTSMQIHFFKKTGGEQPVSLDPKAINHFFVGNFAKGWIMRYGYYPIFLDYNAGEITFKLITDPRFTGDGFFLSIYIAKQYQCTIDLLNGAKIFKVNHHLANDIIGFYESGGISNEEIHQLQNRIQKSMDSISEKPNLIHCGKIR